MSDFSLSKKRETIITGKHINGARSTINHLNVDDSNNKKIWIVNTFLTCIDINGHFRWFLYSFDCVVVCVVSNNEMITCKSIQQQQKKSWKHSTRGAVYSSVRRISFNKTNLMKYEFRLWFLFLCSSNKHNKIRINYNIRWSFVVEFEICRRKLN